MSRMVKMMIACDEAAFLISKSRDAKLTFRESFNLKFHIMTCKLCKRYEKEINALDHYLKQKLVSTCKHHKLEPDQKSRIERRLINEMR
jgi:hypothetical protein